MESADYTEILGAVVVNAMSTSERAECTVTGFKVKSNIINCSTRPPGNNEIQFLVYIMTVIAYGCARRQDKVKCAPARFIVIFSETTVCIIDRPLPLMG